MYKSHKYLIPFLLGALVCYGTLYIKHTYFKKVAEPVATNIIRLPAPNKFIAPLLLSEKNILRVV
jgi:hypothetical protein